MGRSVVQSELHRLREQLAARHGMEESDERLLHTFLSCRDENAFAALVRRHGTMVLAVCRRVLGHQQDAEDAFQATFLILAQSAASLRNKKALAGFLHGAAYRTAMKAKRAAARRRKHESHAPMPSPASAAEELLWREVRAVLDEEISCLPEIYRSVFVLCCLESVSREEAARRLGVKEGTVSSRLTKARELLSRRLIQRGVDLSAILTATTLAALPASAPAVELVSRTSKAAVALAAGKGMADSVRAPVARLMQGASAAMIVSKTRMTMTVLLAASLLGGIGLWSYRGLAAPTGTPPATPPAARGQERRQAAAGAVEKSAAIEGKVLGTDGKPAAGAKLLLLEDGKRTLLGVTAADGRFTVTVPGGRSELRQSWLLARAEGVGIDFLPLDLRKPAKPMELRLVKDHVIRGRVVNTEGKPLPGVRVAIRTIHVFPGGSLSSFLIAWKTRHFQRGITNSEKALWMESAGALLPARTDAEGRFAVQGIGSERVVRLHFQGAGIADTQAWVVNRGGFDPKPYNQATLDNTPKGMERFAARWMLSGPDLSVVAEAERPIRGSVKDADSGKGVPNIVAHLTRKDRDELLDPPLQAATDARGRYEIHGAPKAGAYVLEVNDEPSRGYLRSRLRVEDTAGYLPLTADLRVKKGVLITGKVIDGSTGKAIAGFANAAVLVDNPFARDYPPFDTFFRPEYTAEDGTFRVVAIPGPVLLMGGAGTRGRGWTEEMKYKASQADPRYPKYFQRMSNHWLFHGHGSSNPLQGTFCKVLQIEPGAKVVKQDVVLERASALTVNIEDAEGRPLAGAWAAGIGPEDYYRAARMETASCSVYGVQTRKNRVLAFYEPTRKLAGTLQLQGNEKGPITVRLRPPGAIKGRLVGADGKPLAGMAVQISYRDREADEIRRAIAEVKEVVTDASGAFTLDELIPGRHFFLYVFRRGKPLVEEGWKRREPILHEVKEGERRDLGTLTLKPLPQ